MLLYKPKANLPTGLTLLGQTLSQSLLRMWGAVIAVNVAAVNKQLVLMGMMLVLKYDHLMGVQTIMKSCLLMSI